MRLPKVSLKTTAGELAELQRRVEDVSHPPLDKADDANELGLCLLNGWGGAVINHTEIYWFNYKLELTLEFRKEIREVA